MKYYIVVLYLFLTLSFTGCYTVIWTPEKEFPTESSYYESGYSYYEDAYYADPYYGGYNYYYEYPWWLSMTPPVTSREETKTERTERSNEVREVRRGSGERPSGDNRSGSPTRSTTSSGTTKPAPETSGTTQSTERKNDNSNSGSSDDERNRIRNSGERSGSGRR
jgi:hypothetical protein